ncbi:MAG: DUF4321 domain-containing protein [Syntrophomonadales bacterium]
MGSRGNYRSYPGWPILLVILIVGALIGGWLGEAIVKLVPSLAEIGQVYTVGIPHFTLDLVVLSLSFGLTLKISLFSLLGLIGSYFVYRRM